MDDSKYPMVERIQKIKRKADGSSENHTIALLSDHPFSNCCFCKLSGNFLLNIRSLIPFVRGMRERSSIIPTRPIIIPAIIFPHIMLKHMPQPKDNAPIVPTIIVNTCLPDIRIGALCSIFRQTIRVTKPRSKPMHPNITPCRKTFHWEIRAIHIPSENSIPLTVPNIIAVKLLFFIEITSYIY